MSKIYKMEQRSDEWIEKRKGKMTGSNAQAIAASGKGLETYIIGLLAEKYSNNKEHYTNSDMDRGVELEDSARLTYEIEYEKVEEVGLVEYNDYFVASPDGLTAKGSIEIKCMKNEKHFEFILNKKIDSKYLWQMQGQMLALGREFVDFVAYNPNFDKSLVVVRIERDMAMQEKLIIGIERGTKLIQELEQKFLEAT